MKLYYNFQENFKNECNLQRTMSPLSYELSIKFFGGFFNIKLTDE